MSVLCLAVVGSGEGGKGKGWQEWGRDGRKRREGIGRDGNGEGGRVRGREEPEEGSKGWIELDICPGDPEFLVTPLKERCNFRVLQKH